MDYESKLTPEFDRFSRPVQAYLRRVASVPWGQAPNADVDLQPLVNRFLNASGYHHKAEVFEISGNEGSDNVLHATRAMLGVQSNTHWMEARGKMLESIMNWAKTERQLREMRQVAPIASDFAPRHVVNSLIASDIAYTLGLGAMRSVVQDSLSRHLIHNDDPMDSFLTICEAGYIPLGPLEIKKDPKGLIKRVEERVLHHTTVDYKFALYRPNVVR